MPKSTKLALIVLSVMGIVIAIVFTSRSLLSRIEMEKKAVGEAMRPTTTPLPQENPLHFPVDPKTGTILLPTNSGGMNPFMPNASAAGRIVASSACDQLQKILICYQEKLPKLVSGYESYLQGDLYPNDPPAVRDTKCNTTIGKLAGTTRTAGIQAGCVW